MADLTEDPYCWKKTDGKDFFIQPFNKRKSGLLLEVINISMGKKLD
jgi:hypothetical protein